MLILLQPTQWCFPGFPNAKEWSPYYLDVLMVLTLLWVVIIMLIVLMVLILLWVVIIMC